MAKKRKKQKYGIGSPQSWQTAIINDTYYMAYRTMLMRMAISRFKWLNLPETLDSLQIERELLWKGSVSIAGVDGNANLIYALPYATCGNPDAYLYPLKWRTTSPYARNYYATQETGVICYENLGNFYADSVPTVEIIDMFARELADLARTRQVNRAQQKTPYILEVARENEAAANAILTQKYGNEAAILAVQGFSDTMKSEVLRTDVPYLAADFNEDENNLWARIYQALGISNMPVKAERMLNNEVLSQAEPTNLISLSFLEARRKAAAHINAIYNLNISVVCNFDNISENYDYSHNIQVYTDLQKGGDGVGRI